MSEEDNQSTGEPVTAVRKRILVVDDHPIVRQGLADLIDRQPDLMCCGEAGSLFEGHKAILTLKPDLLLLDLRLGASDGLESIKSIKAQFPDLRVLVISQFDEEIYAERALRAGAAGYVMKEQASEELLQAIRCVLMGEIYVSPRMSKLALKRLFQAAPSSLETDLHSLTDRELHVFNAIGLGYGPKEIAAGLNLSVKTVETYREHLKFKLHLASGAELVQCATQWVRKGMPASMTQPSEGRVQRSGRTSYETCATP
jgi:DNA-binding NarL/FixJ family response regulator